MELPSRPLNRGLGDGEPASSGKPPESDEQSRRLHEFCAAIIHELRGPLVSLEGFTDILSDHYGSRLDDRGRLLLQRIRFNAEHMALILRGLQDLVLVDQDGEPITSVDPEQVIKKLLSDRRETIMAAGANVKVQPNLPALLMQPTKLYLLLDNLVNNALKATSGRPNPQILFGYGCGGHPRAFFVADNGPGIAPAERERVFDLFYRCDRGQPGAGIGLAFVRWVVQRYHGKVWVEETEGGGARVCFEIGTD